MNLLQFLKKHDIQTHSTKHEKEYSAYNLKSCVFDIDHGGAVIIERKTGRKTYTCPHPSCRGIQWMDVKKKILEDETAVREKTLAEKIKDLNEEYFVTQIGGKTVVAQEYWDTQMKRPDLKIMNFDDFIKWKQVDDLVANPNPSGPDYIDIGTAWLKYRINGNGSGPIKRREFERIVFSPNNGCRPAEYNLWRGFQKEPRPGDWSLMKKHLLDMVCSGDQEIYRWVTAWAARLLQEPGGKRPGTAIVMRGIEGCGKGSWVQSLGRIIGSQHFHHAGTQSYLTGRFNYHLKDCLLCFADEITWGGDRQAEGVLKFLVTEDVLRLEPKGKDFMAIKSHINLIVSSNNDWVVPAGLSARRWCVLNVLPDKAGDRSYFDALWHQMEHQGGDEAMMYDLLNMDITNVDLRTVPRTEALFMQQLQSMHPAHRFWFESVLQPGTLLESQDGWELTVPIHELHQAYIDYSDKISGKGHRLTETLLSRKIKEVCPNMSTSRPRAVTGEKRHRMWNFPPLEDCRNAFESSTKSENLIDWGDDDPPF